jgi:quercetin dioxygenase-like cupin family protein
MPQVTGHHVLHRWSDIPSQELAPGVNRRYLTAARTTIARFSLARGAVVPVHSHDHEQVSYVLSGALRFTVSGEDVLVKAGEALQIPSWAEHGVRVEEDAEVIDVFCPVRQDWLDGTDTYFKK